MTDYTDLIVWQRGMLLAESIYEITAYFPKEEQFGLTSQIRRAAVSVPSNIAEGHGRGTKKEFIYFLRVARGSAAEIQTQLVLAGRLSFLSADQAENLKNQYEEIKRMLGAIIVKLENGMP